MRPVVSAGLREAAATLPARWADSYSMKYVTDCMKLIQARIPEAEYELLRREAKRSGKSLQDIIREALRARLLDDTVEPADPLLKAFPLFQSKDGKKARLSERHDEALYGAPR